MILNRKVVINDVSKVRMPDGSVADFDERSIPKNGKPTKAAIKLWKTSHGDFIFGYVPLVGLTAEDVLSVLSASQKGLVRLGHDSEGQVNSFKLVKAA